MSHDETSGRSFSGVHRGCRWWFLLAPAADRLARAAEDSRRRKKTPPTSAASRRSARSYVQFDLRFYVVALLFIIFDVEVSFFFPWALVFGKATQLADHQSAASRRACRLSERLLERPGPAALTSENGDLRRERADRSAGSGLVDMLVFFAVLLVGFAYVWKRGDLDWVRAVTEKSRQPRPAPASSPRQPSNPSPSDRIASPAPSSAELESQSMNAAEDIHSKTDVDRFGSEIAI